MHSFESRRHAIHGYKKRTARQLTTLRVSVAITGTHLNRSTVESDTCSRSVQRINQTAPCILYTGVPENAV